MQPDQGWHSVFLVLIVVVTVQCCCVLSWDKKKGRQVLYIHPDAVLIMHQSRYSA